MGYTQQGREQKKKEKRNGGIDAQVKERSNTGINDRKQVRQTRLRILGALLLFKKKT